MKFEFRPDQVRVGDMVYWWNQGDLTQKPSPALVTQVNMHGTLSLSIFEPDRQTINVRDSVQHVSSPKAKNDDRRDSGLWDYMPLPVWAADLMRQLTSLVERTKAMSTSTATQPVK